MKEEVEFSGSTDDLSSTYFCPGTVGNSCQLCIMSILYTNIYFGWTKCELCNIKFIFNENSAEHYITITTIRCEYFVRNEHATLE